MTCKILKNITIKILLEFVNEKHGLYKLETIPTFFLNYTSSVPIFTVMSEILNLYKNTYIKKNFYQNGYLSLG